MKSSMCVVFDIDDTLYLERDYVQSGFEAVGRWAAKWIGMQDFGARCWANFCAGIRNSIFNEALRQSGRQPTPELIATLVQLYRTHIPSIGLTVDASEALKAVSGTASIAVVSDGPATSQSRKAEALGLDSFAEPIVLTDLLGTAFCKPHTRAFEHVMQCRPADLYLYIADNPLKDFIAPKALGWMTVRVRRPGGLHQDAENRAIPDFEMTDCSGVAGVLAHL